MKLVWTDQSIRKLDEIFLYIAMDSPVGAGRWVANLIAKVDRLREFPQSGRRVPEVPKKEFRELVVGNYRIIYRIARGTVFILTVRHFKQILPTGEID